MPLPPPVPLPRANDDRTPILIPDAPEGRWTRPRGPFQLQQGLFLVALVMMVILAFAMV
ncbi:MAG: hypothetical protein ABIR59_07525 [Gemmatimonadales bacterium]